MKIKLNLFFALSLLGAFATDSVASETGSTNISNQANKQIAYCKFFEELLKINELKLSDKELSEKINETINKYGINVKDELFDEYFISFVGMEEISTEIISYLIKVGVNVNSRYKGIIDFSNSSIIAVSVMEMLHEYLIDITPIMVAVLSEDVKKVELLIQNGADVNARINSLENPRFGASVLFMVTQFKYGEIKKTAKIIDMLIKAGANANVADHLGNTPFMNACENNNLLVCNLLTKCDVDINAQNKDGKTALIKVYDVLKSHDEIYSSTLTDAQKDVFWIKKTKTSLKTYDYLINSGANINIKDKQDHNGFISLEERSAIENKIEQLSKES